jgi:hypothetical protein
MVILTVLFIWLICVVFIVAFMSGAKKARKRLNLRPIEPNKVSAWARRSKRR